MKKNRKRLTAAAAIVLALAMLLSSCAGANKHVAQDVMTDGGNGFGGYRPGFSTGTTGSIEGASKDEMINTSPSIAEAPLINGSKIIYTANISLQSTEFEKTLDFIKQFASQNYAVIESEHLNNNGIYNKYSTKNVQLTVRVPAEFYNKFISGISDDCHVVSINQDARDVGEEYFDIEQRLETLNNKHDRLEALLKKAEQMSDIIDLEEALAETEYQINRYRTDLKRYDSLITYSTVNIYLQEVERTDDGIGEKPGFFERLGKSFTSGLNNFAEGAEDLAFWVSYNILTIAILAVIAVLLIKVKPFRRAAKKASKIREEKKAAKQVLISGEESSEK